MDFLFHNDVVQYKCSCGQYKRLYNAYFCRHCMALRCRICVIHEVDSQYCQHCLEYIPTIDPKFQMNKCASCYQCPSCQHLLSTSVLSISPAISNQQLTSQSPDEQVVKRTCQLICEFCRWSSEKFVIEGSQIANSFADVEIKNGHRIDELMSFYKAVSQKEKNDKKKRRFHSRNCNTMDLLKKYGIDNTLSPKLFESLRARTNFQDKTYGPAAKRALSETKTSEDLAIEAFKPAIAFEVEKKNMDFYYSQDFNLDNIGGIAQRLSQVELQPELVSDFKPISKSLSVKRSLRCKDCERNLCRNEYSPVSIRFKIQSAAYYHVPELRLRTDVYPVRLKLNEINIVEFSLQNHTLSRIKLKMSQVDEESRDNSYELKLPPNELSLGPKDDTIDYEHVPLQLRPLNEETQVTFSSPFKLGFFMKVKPLQKTRDKLSVEFLLSHDVLLIQNPRDNDKIERITHKVKVALGYVE